MYDRLHAHIEKQRLAETEIYILDPMTAQLTHETRLTSIALSTTSFPSHRFKDTHWYRNGVMVLSIDACMRCGGLTKRFLKHRYNVSLVKHMTIIVLSMHVPSTPNDRE